MFNVYLFAVRRHIPKTLFVLVLMSSVGLVAQAETPQRGHHELNLTLLPAESRLIGIDTVTIKTADMSQLSFLLAKAASIKSINVNVNGREVVFDFTEGIITLQLEGNVRGSDISIVMNYDAVFDDPLPHLPSNTEDPGYGVTGTISEHGAFFLLEAGWYPRLPGSRTTFHLRVEAPRGMITGDQRRAERGSLHEGVKTNRMAPRPFSSARRPPRAGKITG
jgi:hypothetical protein